jgi:IS5 family transposase
MIMRNRFEQQLSLGILPIAEVVFPLRSRHELAPILAGLQRIFTTPALNAAAFGLMEACIYGESHDSQRIGRPGMSLWEVLVLGVVRLGTDSNWDALLQMANYDSLLRGVLGVDGGFGSVRKEYCRQTVVDNVSLLDEATVNGINALVVGEGHRILKKKRDQGLEVKGDSYVLESNIHYPTDTGLLWDSARKCLYIMEFLSCEHGFGGWRKAGDWRSRLKSAERKVSQAFRTRGQGREQRVAFAAQRYIALAEALEAKVADALPGLEALFASVRVAEKHKLITYYHGMLVKHLGLVRRRLLDGEQIPQSEKLFSIFQPMVEWISKGKAGKRVEFGHKVLIATDQYGLILYHRVVQRTDDRDLAVPLAEALAAKYKLRSLSLDKGFYSKANKDAIKLLVPVLVMPKKGSLSAEDRLEESGREFKALRNRHSAVESNINQLEHNGLNRCPDVGFEAFKRYSALGVLSYNLHRVGSALLAEERKREAQLQPLQKAA